MATIHNIQEPLAEYGNPQKENGYTPIANELLEAILRSDFSKRQLLIILAVARETFGYSKKSDALSRVQLSKITNIDRANVSRTIDELIKINVIFKHESGRKSHGILVNELSINKHYFDWLTDAKTAQMPKQHRCQNDTLTDAKLARELMPKQHTHKAIKTIKQDISKKTKIKNSETTIPPDFSVSERVKKWADLNGHKNLQIHLENFVLTCESKNYKYSNWDSAFMKAISNNWAKIYESKKQDPKTLNGMVVI